MNKKTFWVTWAVCLGLAFTAFLFLKIGLIDYGITLFCILPACIGLFTGIIPRKTFAVLGMIAGLAVFVLILWTGQLEGLVCVALALPVIVFFIFVGYIVALIIKYFTRNRNKLQLSFLPLALFLLSTLAEYAWQGNEEESAITNSIILPASTKKVYDLIKHVDTVTVSASLLHRMGLPYPTKCVMTEERVGGLRICYFDIGSITETITGLKENELLRMKISAYDLPGAAWFFFNEDIYQIRPMANQTIITRTTTYASRLKPRLYWKWIEEITIGTEQKLVFENLENEVAHSTR